MTWRRSRTDIIASQQREVDQMLVWREQWFGSRTLGPILPEVLGVPENELGMKHGSADEVSGAVDVDVTFAQMISPTMRAANWRSRATLMDGATRPGAIRQE